MEYIDRYEITDTIGSGGMATIYKAHDPRFDRDVAIKVIKRHLLEDGGFASQRFQREAQVVAQIAHPFIVATYDFGEENDVPYIVMQYMPGGTLRRRLDDHGPLSLADAIDVTHTIAEALDAAHRKGLIHRDIKPSNILFDEWGKAYLSDFGIVKILEASTDLTRDHILGTPHYLAPEMVDGETTAASDIYALGVMLYEMLTGRPPFNDDSSRAIMLAHMSRAVPDIRDQRPDIPAAVHRVIRRAMAKPPSERYPSAAALVDNLDDIEIVPETTPMTPPEREATEPVSIPSPMADITSPSDPTPEPTPTPEPPAARGGIPGWVPWAVVVAVIVVAVVVIAILVLGGQQPPPPGRPKGGDGTWHTVPMIAEAVYFIAA